MTDFFRKYIEWLLILQVIFSMVLIYLQVEVGYVLNMLTTWLLAFFYLLSSIRVIRDKRIERLLKLLYFFGLTSYALGWMGMMLKINFWPGSNEILILGCSGTLVVLIFYFLRFQKEDNSFNIQPLLIRGIPFILLFAYFALMSPTNTYGNFGRFKDDVEFSQAFIQAFENPEDPVAQEKLDHLKRLKENEDQ